MTDYRPPLRDIRFVLSHLVDLERIQSFPGFEHAEPDLVFGALDEAGRFVSDVIAPLYRVGDTHGSTLTESGDVVTPPGYREAYRRFVESGWPAAAFPEAWGGGGLPFVVGLAVSEMVTTADLAFSLGPMLTYSAVELLLEHGTDEQRATYLEELVSGEWAGTMVLTEPQAGSDVGAVKARAVPLEDGTWRITGQKIYITFGDHDLTDNIVHMVLARAPEAPPGTKGISCFIVPKYLVNADGSLGERNDVTTVSLEHKLGIHASPTAVLSFGDAGGAVGYLVGEVHQGMRSMFTMMNNARLQVGLEGLGTAERAYQLAAAFAVERTQGRALGAPKGVTSPIIEHPDVRRTLMLMRARTEAMRALLYLNGEAIDLAAHSPEETERERASAVAAILTPISKAWCTDVGVDVASLGIQVHGGMGYVEETGAAQIWRDARIAPIYEGTNGIQAQDLVMRKLPLAGGEVVRRLLDDMRATAALLDGDLAPLANRLGEAVEALDEAGTWLLTRLGEAPNDALAGATPYLEMFGVTLGGWLMCRSALAARSSEAGEPAGFLASKVATARFYADHVLPTVRGLLGSVTAGADATFAVPVEAFT
jgi:alkylation response protein AidB-like acyl-CoA dehydrogenase